MTRRPHGPSPRAAARPRRLEVTAGPYDGQDIVRVLERQGFVAAGEGSGGARVYEHDDGRTVIAQPSLPACVRPGDRVFNLLAHDLGVTPAVLLRLLALSRRGGG